jgi:hypothetical protein
VTALCRSCRHAAIDLLRIALDVNRAHAAEVERLRLASERAMLDIRRALDALPAADALDPSPEGVERARGALDGTERREDVIADASGQLDAAERQLADLLGTGAPGADTYVAALLAGEPSGVLPAAVWTALGLVWALRAEIDALARAEVRR